MEHGSQEAEPLTSARAIGLSPADLRVRLTGDFTPRPAVYWIDLLGSSLLGWSAFLIAGHLSPGGSALALVVATLALYRAVLFIHELCHLRPDAVPGFEAVWNLTVGFPLVVPSLMYWSHSDHHKRSVYGTDRDPEYESIAHWSPLRIALSTLSMTVFPALLALRWAVIGPVSWLVRPLRRAVVSRLSTLVINPAYRRRAPRGEEARRWRRLELGAALVCWAGVAGLVTGQIGLDWLARWYAVGVGILVLNHVRTLAAHRYENQGERLDVLGQLLDSVNLPWLPGVTVLFAPVGLRYHGLHHLLPTLPYHSLGRVHRRLLAELPASSPYRRAEMPGLGVALASLLSRSFRNTRRRSPGS